ncbi:unnamed protein product, partial [Chrysoparadoxa australica]
SAEGHEELLKCHEHEGSCRSVLFSEDGQSLFTAGADGKLRVLDIQSHSHRFDPAWEVKAHDCPVNTLCIVSENLVASGDDQGAICVWDIRTRGKAMQHAAGLHTDFISDMTLGAEGKDLLASSGDATLSVFDTRQRKLLGRSDDQEDELLSVQVLKHGRKVVCGSQNGVLLVWSYGTWGDCSDRFPGHPNSVDTLLQLDEDTLLSGSSDGLIRVVAIQPNRFMGVLGDHNDFPVESIKFSHDARWIASASHDSLVR